MNLTKILSSLVVVGALTACAQNVPSEANFMPKKAVEMAKSEKTLVPVGYICDVKGKKNKVVSATYEVRGNEVVAVTVMVDGVVVGHEMKLNPSYKDGIQFVEGKKVWSLDEGFSRATINKTDPVMFTSNNKILAKNCHVAQ